MDNGYPINLLRNIALSKVHTSHFIVSDIDLWPSTTSYDAILALGRRYLSKPRNALVVPAFEYNSEWDMSVRGTAETVALELPDTFEQLRECFDDMVDVDTGKRCRIFKAGSGRVGLATHESTDYEQWWQVRPFHVPAV